MGCLRGTKKENINELSPSNRLEFPPAQSRRWQSPYQSLFRRRYCAHFRFRRLARCLPPLWGQSTYIRGC